jgi:release factor glutamine methyltransferase
MSVLRYFSRMAAGSGVSALLPPGSPPTLEEAVSGGALLLERAGIESARLDAECLLGHVLGWPRWRLLLAADRRLSAEEFAEYLRRLERRERREPLAYVTGGREFWSLPLTVSRDVLVPRPETETVVEAALAICRGQDLSDHGPRTMDRGARSADLTIVDLCTGSGAIAIALARELPAATLYASDISWRALKVARANAAAQGVAERITFLRGHVWRPVAGVLQGRPADLVTANPPYIPSGVIPGLMPELSWEPRRALDGGPDGLEIIRDIGAGAPDHLRAGGALLLEIGADQGQAVRMLVEASGAFEACRILPDLAGCDRVAVARRRGK